MLFVDPSFYIRLMIEATSFEKSDEPQFEWGGGGAVLIALTWL